MWCRERNGVPWYNEGTYDEFQGESRRWVHVPLLPRHVGTVAKTVIHPENSLLAVLARRLSTRLQEVPAVTGRWWLSSTAFPHRAPFHVKFSFHCSSRWHRRLNIYHTGVTRIPSELRERGESKHVRLNECKYSDPEADVFPCSLSTVDIEFAGYLDYNRMLEYTVEKEVYDEFRRFHELSDKSKEHERNVEVRKHVVYFTEQSVHSQRIGLLAGSVDGQ